MTPKLRQWCAAGLLALFGAGVAAQAPADAPAPPPAAPAAADTNAERAKTQPYNNAPHTIRLGGSYDKIEFCDLLKDHRTLIHVKFYRSSSTLSHLFAQGHVAAETFVKDEQFRERLNTKLPPASRLVDTQARPDASQYSVIYAIATNKTLPTELPFFSKVSLKNATRTLRALNYDVALTRIPVNGDWLRTSKLRGYPP